jgi:sorbitol/mannitol transport system permease protein
MTQTELVAGRRTTLPIVGGAVGWVQRNGLVVPAVIFAVVVTQAPFVLTIWFSLQKWNLLRPENSRFNGIGNYIDILTRGDFISALIVTVILTFSSVAAALVIGLGLADLVNQRFPGRNVVRTLLITPFLVMPVVAALGWKTTLLNPVFGIVDWLMTSVGLPRVDWFAEYPLVGITTIIVWRWAPFMMLILLAGLQALSDEVREASKVDGASTWQEFRFIELPHLKSYMQLCVLLGTIYILSEFDTIYMTTQGGPGDQTTNLPYLIYQQVFVSSDVGHASAMGVLVVIIVYAFASYFIKLLSQLMRGNQ